jgi:uncharacterized protein (DUF1499 family)
MIPAWLAFFEGILAVTLVAAGIVGAHFYLTTPFMGFLLFVFGFLFSLIGIVFGLIGLLMTRSEAKRAARPRAVFGTLMCVLIAVPVILVISTRAKYPPINDITTDFEQPPEYVHAMELVPNWKRDMKYNRDKYMAAQQSGYPPLKPASVVGEESAVFQRVQNAAASIPDWQITFVDPKTYTLEGVSTSKVFHFQDDFIIQVRGAPGATSLVEMRSKSRDGTGDGGVNYNRIIVFLSKLKPAG